MISKIAQELEQSMANSLSGSVDVTQDEEIALTHLEKAQNILANAGFEDLSMKVAYILNDYADMLEVK